MWGNVISLIIRAFRRAGSIPDQSSSRKLEDIARDIHVLRRLQVIGIVERHMEWVAGNAFRNSARLRILCEELSEFAIRTSKSAHPASRTTALKTIYTLAVEDPYIRNAFTESEETRRRLQELKLMPDLTSDETEWASIALEAIVNNTVNEFWTNAITEPMFEQNVQWLKTNTPIPSNIGISGPASPDDGSSPNLYVAIAEKLMIGGPSEREVLLIDRHIRRLQRQKTDDTIIQTLCKKLFMYASHDQTADASLKAILALSVQGCFSRSVFEDGAPHVQDVRRGRRPEDPSYLWASILLYAFEHHEELNKYWSEKTPAPIGSSRISCDGDEVLNLAKKLSGRTLSSTSDCSELAGLYFELAAKLSEVEQIGDDDMNLDNMERGLVATGCATKESDKCDKCGGNHKTYLKSSKELLDYVLKAAPSGSLTDLSSVVPQTIGRGGNVGEGGFATVFKLSTPIGGKTVAIKVLRLHYRDEDFVACNGHSVLRNFARELRVLAHLDHPNVLKLIGYSLLDEQYCFASEYMDKGDLKNYMVSGEGNIHNLFIISLGIAKGLCYLHSSEVRVVHGDLKTLNILVNSSGKPVLADFGLSRMAESLVSKGYYSTVLVRASLRWAPYEFFHWKDEIAFRPTPKSDVWSFGMTLLELLTNKFPYAGILNDGGVQTAIAEGRLPEKPVFDDSDPDTKLKEDLWSACEECWTLDSFMRPTMMEIEDRLIRIKYRHGITMYPE